MANVILYVLFLWQQGKLILMGSLPNRGGVVRVSQRPGELYRLDSCLVASTSFARLLVNDGE